MRKGFSFIEVMIVIVIMSIVTGMVMSWFVKYNKTKGLEKDVETIVESLHQARDFTLASKNASSYGVHFASSTATIFTGTVYSAGDSQNLPFTLETSDIIVDLNLTGNGYDVVFKRLTGETDQDGTVIITSASISKTKTVTIYKTGVVQSD